MFLSFFFVQSLYKPCRVRKRKGGFPANELEQVNATLSEYDKRMMMHTSANKGDTKSDDGLDFLVRRTVLIDENLIFWFIVQVIYLFCFSMIMKRLWQIPQKLLQK